jgi:hypothetical protein
MKKVISLLAAVIIFSVVAFAAPNAVMRHNRPFHRYHGKRSYRHFHHGGGYHRHYNSRAHHHGNRHHHHHGGRHDHQMHRSAHNMV